MGAFKARDFIHFIDNRGALAQIVSGAAAEEDLSSLADLQQILSAKLGARSWSEYVESSANIADGPSRLGRLW